MDLHQEVSEISKKELVHKFSCFWTILEGAQHPKRTSDSKTQKYFKTIFSYSNETVLSDDAWARFLLFYFRRIASFDDSGSVLSALSEIVKQCPSYNEDLLTIYQQIEQNLLQDKLMQYLSHDPHEKYSILVAYLHYSCWHSAKVLESRKTECFEIAVEAASQPLRLLQNFELARQQGNNSKIRTFATIQLSNIIRDTLKRNDLQTRTQLFSDWGVLIHAASKKRTKQILISLGKKTEEIVIDLLILSTYQELSKLRVKNSSKKIPPPEDSDLQRICDRCHERLRKQPELLTELSTNNQLDLSWLNSNAVKETLEAIAKAIKTYYTPQSTQTRIEDSVDTRISPEEYVFQKEESKYFKILEQSFSKAFKDLEIPLQHMILLWKGLGISQSQVIQLLGSQLNIKKQYELTRKWQRAKKVIALSLLTQFQVQFPEDFAHQKVPDKLVESLLKPIDEYSEEFCSTFFKSPLNQALNQLYPEERELLRTYRYFCQIEDSTIPPNLLHLDVKEVGQRIKQTFKESLQAWIEKELKLSADLCPVLMLEKFIDDWLENEAI
jgi:hypothetical protein